MPAARVRTEVITLKLLQLMVKALSIPSSMENSQQVKRSRERLGCKMSRANVENQVSHAD